MEADCSSHLSDAASIAPSSTCNILLNNFQNKFHYLRWKEAKPHPVHMNDWNFQVSLKDRYQSVTIMQWNQSRL
jgi:hypothetical protein